MTQLELTAVAQFESVEEADEAVAVLRDRGISAVFADGGLLGPEYHANRAIQLLTEATTVPQPGLGPLVCPECGGFDVRTIPPYAHMFAAVVAGTVFFAFATKAPILGYAAITLMIAGVPVWYWLVRVSGKQKCRRCGWMFSE